MKKVEELEKIIAYSSSSVRLPSLSLDRISIHSQQEPRNMNINIPNKSTDQLDQTSLISKTKLSPKHLSTPSLGELSTDSDFLSTKTQFSIVPSLDQPYDDDYIEIKDWTIDQCIQWLTAQQMTSLIPIFINRNINGEKLLLLDSVKIKAMGIKSSKDREQLKTKIKELKRAELNRLRERLLNRSSSTTNSGKRFRSSSLTRLRERKFFSSSDGK